MSAATKPTLRPELEPLPERMQDLAIDDRGYVCPWFISWVDNQPEFRCMDARKLVEAVRSSLCWVCGKTLGRYLAFTLGPMCAVNRINSEPPSHRECAEWSARNCPFLSRPRMVRRENDLPEEVREQAGCPIDRNPGCTIVWVTRDYRLIKAHGGNKGVLFSLGDPLDVTAWREGRPATMAEVLESIHSGVPLLEQQCDLEREDQRDQARRELREAVARCEVLLSGFIR